LNCDLDLSSSATAPILRGALLGGESEWAFFAFFKHGCRKRTDERSQMRSDRIIASFQ